WRLFSAVAPEHLEQVFRGFFVGIGHRTVGAVGPDPLDKSSPDPLQRHEDFKGPPCSSFCCDKLQNSEHQSDKNMNRKYFGTDGIRGTVGQAPITPDFVLRLAHAVGRVLKQTEERPLVLIGKDTRISGYML